MKQLTSGSRRCYQITIHVSLFPCVLEIHIINSFNVCFDGVQFSRHADELQCAKLQSKTFVTYERDNTHDVTLYAESTRDKNGYDVTEIAIWMKEARKFILDFKRNAQISLNGYAGRKYTFRLMIMQKTF